MSEHSQSKVFAYCAQYWPQQHKVELAILDTGIGLFRSLSQNPYLELINDQDALKYALMPGISGKTYEGVKIRLDDVWQNSGYGLYMNYRLCNEGGSFFICSGTRALNRSKDQNDNLYYNIGFLGTAIRLRLNTQNLRNVEEMIKQFGDEGEAVAKHIGMGAIPRASTMSRMLKNNFKTAMPKVEIGDTIKHKLYAEGMVTDCKITPQGEMLWVSFKNGRTKKVLRNDVIVINTDDYVYYNDDAIIQNEEVEVEEEVINLEELSDDNLPYDSGDSFFDF